MKKDLTTNPKQSFQEKQIRFRNYQGEDEITTYAEIQAEIEEHKDRYKTMLTYFPSLDHVDSINGVESGELIVISGPTKAGKTLFAKNFKYIFCNLVFHSLCFYY